MSVLIDASGDAIRRESSSPGPTLYTVVGWAWRDVQAADQIIADISDSGGSNFQALYWGSSTELFIYSQSYDQFASVPGLDTWFQWYMRCTGSSLSAGWRYPGGSWVTASTTGANFTAAALCFGNDIYSGYEFEGRFANCKVYNAHLTPQQIEIELAQYLPKHPNTLSWYPMFPGATERVRDYAGLVDLTPAGTLTDADPPPIGWGRHESGLLLPLGAAAGTIHRLEGFQLFNDDGDKDNATTAQNQDVNHTIQVGGKTRLRNLIEAPTATPYQLECAEDGTENWFTMDVEPGS